MIRKPTEQDFREGNAVNVLRESKRAAVASRDGVGRGFRNVTRGYAYGVFWFGILTTAIPAMFEGHFITGPLFIAAAYGVQQLVRKGSKRAIPLLNGRRQPPPEPADPRDILAAAQFEPQVRTQGSQGIRQAGEYKLRPSVAAREAMSLALPGMVLLFVGIAFVILMVPGLILFATAILILFKAAFDRDLLRFDHRQVTVNSLLTKRTVAWADVIDVTARVHSWFNVKVLMTIGSRRAIVLTAHGLRGEFYELLLPIGLLDLDKDGLTALVADLISCRAAGGLLVPAWQPAPPPPREYKPTPAGDPRESFDPDAIMARYLAERKQVVQQVRPELTGPQMGRKTFGRKIA